MSKDETVDMVNNPPHYMGRNGMQSMDILDEFLEHPDDFFRGNAIKYLIRYPNKNGLEDVKKARFYINKLIEYLENKEK